MLPCAPPAHHKKRSAHDPPTAIVTPPERVSLGGPTLISLYRPTRISNSNQEKTMPLYQPEMLTKTWTVPDTRGVHTYRVTAFQGMCFCEKCMKAAGQVNKVAGIKITWTATHHFQGEDESRDTGGLREGPIAEIVKTCSSQLEVRTCETFYLNRNTLDVLQDVVRVASGVTHLHQSNDSRKFFHLDD